MVYHQCKTVKQDMMNGERSVNETKRIDYRRGEGCNDPQKYTDHSILLKPNNLSQAWDGDFSVVITAVRGGLVRQEGLSSSLFRATQSLMLKGSFEDETNKHL